MIKNARVNAVITKHIPTLYHDAVLLPNLSIINPIKKHPRISPSPNAIIASSALKDASSTPVYVP